MRNIYIDNIDLQKAKETYERKLNLTPTFESVKVRSSHNRITKEAIFAKASSPAYNASAMDGIAVIVKRTEGASEVTPKALKLETDFIYVNTGNVISEPYNAVIMIEDVVVVDDFTVKIISPAHPWQHVRPIGEDIIEGEMVVPSNHQIRGIDLGALVAAGISQIDVYKPLKVGILPTGNEIINDPEEIGSGKIIDSNSAMFEGLILENGGNANRYTPVSDDYGKLKSAILTAVHENDLILINAGSSAGSKDFTVHLIKELGEVLVHGIAIKPGKPTILGIIGGKPVIGIPGYPVSSYISFEHFAKPLIRQMSGLVISKEATLEVTVARRIVSSFKHQEKVRVTIGKIGDRYMAVPLTRGAGTTMSLVRADGIITIPQHIEGLEAGEVTTATLLKPLHTICHTLVSTGSHDLIMDYFSDHMPLSSSHVGSMAGIMALRKKECHIAPIHLLDEVSGEYNIAHSKKYFKGKEMVLIRGVKREQGLMVQKGNPENIHGMKDLTKDAISYISRQNGAGTRVLLDYELKKLDINPKDIIGYERIAPTHMAVAIAVFSGAADSGMGIRSAADAMNLDFISIGYESYDFLAYKESLDLPEMKTFIDLLKSDEFNQYIEQLSGYNTENTGAIIPINEVDQ